MTIGVQSGATEARRALSFAIHPSGVWLHVGVTLMQSSAPLPWDGSSYYALGERSYPIYLWWSEERVHGTELSNSFRDAS